MSSFRQVVVCALLAANLFNIPTALALASSQNPLNLAQFTHDGGDVAQPTFYHPPSPPIDSTSLAIPPQSQPTPQPQIQSQSQPQGEPLESSPTLSEPQRGPSYVYDPKGTYPDPDAQAWAYHYAHGGMDPAGAVYFFPVPGVTDRPPVSDYPAVPHALDDESDEDDEDDGLTLMHYAPRKPQRDSPADQHPREDAEIQRMAGLLRLTIVMVVGMALLAFKLRYNLLRPRKDGEVALDRARAAQDNVHKQENSTVLQKC